MFTRRALITLLIPLFIEQSLAMTIGIADTIMVSSVGEAAVSSVSLVDNINLLLSNIFTALASGGAVIVAQYIGRGDRENANTAAKQLIYASIILTIFITVVSISFNQQILRLIFGKIDADVMTNAEIYYYITAASYPFLALYNAGAALFRVMRNTKVSMFTSIIMNIISISGNAITIFIFKMGVTGAALTTLLARIVGAVIILILITNKSNIVFVEKIFKPQINFNMIKKILNIGIPNGLENGMFQIGKLLVAGIITIFGTSAIAANAVSNTVSGIVVLPGSAIGIAMITVIGQCVGAGDYDQAIFNTKRLMKMIYIFTGFFNLPVLLFTPQLVSLFQLSDIATKTAIEVIRIYAVANFLIWPLSFSLPTALRASGDARFTMATSITSMWLFRIGFSYLFAVVMDLGLHGVWFGMYVDWIFRSTVFIIRFVRGKWKKVRVI